MQSKIKEIITSFRSYHEQTVPLCAAENITSEFVRLPLGADFQERYIMDNYTSFNQQNNFIGSDHLVPIYSMIQDQCHNMLNTRFSDARTLSGMNCMVTLLMSLTKSGDKIMIISDEWGGHASVQHVCQRLGLIIYNAPYLVNEYDLDYDSINQIIQTERIGYILLAPSDIIKPLAVNKINLSNAILLYDVSQIMGLIYTGLIENPLEYSDQMVIFGGTHKTIPGPTSGLILTNNPLLYSQIEKEINPKFLRHTQMHQVVSLLFALLELENYGNEYLSEVVRNANTLGRILSEKGFEVANFDNKYSLTHQIFMNCSQNKMDTIYKNCICHGITLNKKEKPLFNGSGVRIGVQEITRYGWSERALYMIGDLFIELAKDNPNEETIGAIKRNLPNKNINYTFPVEVVDSFRDCLYGNLNR